MRKLLLLSSLVGIANANGFYVGVDAGLANQSFIYNNSNLGPQLSGSQLTASGTAPGAQLGLYGGYDFTSHWGVELGYQYLFNTSNVTGAAIGTNDQTGTFNMNSQLINLLAVGTLPIEDSNFAVYAKLGLAYAFPQFGQYCTPNACATGNLPSGSGVTIAGGLGLKYLITRNWDTHIEVMNYGAILPVTLTSNGNNVGSWSNTSILIGGGWHF